MEQNTLKSMKFGKEKLKTFWYYYKKQIIVGLLVLAMVIGFTAQCAGKKDAELYIYFAGPVYFSSDRQEELCAAFQAVLPEGTVSSIGMITTPIASSGESILVSGTEEEKQEDEDKQIGGVYNGTYNDAKADFEDRLRLSEAVICVFSPHCYQLAKKAGMLRPMNELFETLPDGTTEDGYGVSLSEVPAFTDDPAFDAFPDNAILCFKVKTMMQSSGEYETAEKVFAAFFEE